jgi:hypothetical protein
VIRVADQMPDQGRSDEACSARDHDSHAPTHLQLYNFRDTQTM